MILLEHTAAVLPLLKKAAQGKPTLRPPGFIPSIVLSAFSLELFLKCLHQILSGGYAPKHNLHDLYKSLPASIQTDIADSYQKAKDAGRYPSSVPPLAMNGTPHPAGHYDIEAVLTRIGRAFEMWRYSFEYEFREEYSGVGPLSEALIVTIVGLRPDIAPVTDEHVRAFSVGTDANSHP